MTTEKEFKEVVKEVLFARPPEKSLYQNKKPTEKELHTPFKLQKK